MGVQDLSKMIRKDKLVTNTSLKLLRLCSPLKDRIAIDISVVIVPHLSATASAQSLLHSKPFLPVPSIAAKVVKFLRPLIEADFLLFLVFDGATASIKHHEHLRRYGDKEEKLRRLDELYDNTIDGTRLLEKDDLEEVLKLRKGLLSLRPDIIFDIMEKVKSAYPDRVYFVGSPFEADHQLASLFHQDVVDYIYTIDSDLTVCGTDVITNLSDNGSCWVATYDHLMNSKLPKMFKTANSTPKVITYTDELLRHIACYLGNDYIGRCHQNGVGTIGKNFIVKIANEDGTLKESKVVEETIKERCSKMHETFDQW